MFHIRIIIWFVVLASMFSWTIYDYVIGADKNTDAIHDISIHERNVDIIDLVSKSKPAEIGLNIGNQAPDFKLETLAGVPIQLSELRGKRILLNFWATWCLPCRTEMPDMERLAQEHDVEVIAVNLTPTETSLNDVSHFVDELGLTFQIPLDIEGELTDVYQILSVPTTYMIDQNGYIQQKVYGAISYEYMVESVYLLDL